MRAIGAGFLCLAGWMLSACGGTTPASVTIGGTVSGLATGASLELENNGGTPFTVSANGSYTSSATLMSGASYDITIADQPAGESCTVSNGTGTVGTTSVANILITCTAKDYTISGSLAGLLGGRTLIVQDNGGNSNTLSADGTFSFSTQVPSGSNYAVTILTQPAGQSCAVTKGSGTVAAANVTDVSISCSDDTYNVGVTVSGLNANGLQLTDNGIDTLTVSANGNLNFNTPIASGSRYFVTIVSQPLGETCSVANASGTILSSNVTNVTVNCIPKLYPISGTLTGLLSGRSLILQDNGTSSTTVAGNGQFSFLTPVASGSGYSVTVFTQPAGQSCAVTHGSGTVEGSAVSNVSIACSDDTYNIGVTVSGVIRSGLVLEDNGADNLTVSANGSFNFSAPVPSGSPYAVTLLTQPAGESCAVTNGSGTVIAANITVPVLCGPLYYSIGGTLTGLSQHNSLVLEDDGGNATQLSANGSFGFSGQVASGSPYAVTVLVQPSGQSCAVSNGSGTVVSSNITTVSVDCSGANYNIGVTVSGLGSGTSLVLQDNGGDNLTVSANGSADFSTPLASGSDYSVTISTQPLGEDCMLTNASGTVNSSNVNVTVSCAPNFYSVSGAVSGLRSGNSVILELDGADDTTVSANSSFSFSNEVPSGSTYSVTVGTQPPGQTCAVSNGSGTVEGADVTNVAVVCSSQSYDIGVTVSGLTGSGLVLQDNGGDNLSISANGSVNFATPIPSGSTYSVTVLTQPTGETCTVTSASGTVTSANVTGIPVSCASNYTIGGSVSGLTGTVVLQDNGGDNLTLSANGSFTFATTLADGSAYAVTILAQPQGLLCAAVANGSGAVSAANVTNVSVVCGDWTWVSGLDTVDGSGVYGTQGVASTGNVAGARYAANSWTDASGNMWLFGGIGHDSVGGNDLLNDLWEYNSRLGTWEWVNGSNMVDASGVYGSKGVASTTNAPGARYSASSWTDGSGNMWLFGGYGLDATGASGQLNDLWKFNPTAGTWEWVYGPTTVNYGAYYGNQGVAAPGALPGGRSGAVSWTDSSGNLWLFGGIGEAYANEEGNLNDLWKFNPTTGIWEWISGSNAVNASGVYGTQGVPASGNVPGARSFAVSWTDAAGNFWLFGGSGYDSAGNAGSLNDLWEFNPTAGTWEWVSGSNVNGAAGAYGTQGVASSGNVPGARSTAVSWTDASGNFWLFSGYGNDSSGIPGLLNDLWEFNPTAGTWSWVSGASSAGANGVYGTQGVASISNVPGARSSAISWIDSAGNLWLFGGDESSSPGSGYLNDLWEYVP